MISHAQIAVMRAVDFEDGAHYAWVCTRDRSHEISQKLYPDSAEESLVGATGPRLATDEMIEKAKASTRRWRLLDEGDIDGPAEEAFGEVVAADRRLVYEGTVWVGDEERYDDFAPLWDLGPAYGCTEIAYWNEATQRWESL